MPRSSSPLNVPPASRQEEVKDLFLDPQNPRIAEKHLSLEDQDGIVAVLWKEREVQEIVDSIMATGGYWQHEILFAEREERKLVVVEGNRRLAAVKVLVDENLRGRLRISGLPKASATLKQRLRTLPVVVCSRREIWQYIGFKHVNGPQDWDSIAKAQYIARVHNEFEVPLDEIASTIGDRHETVRRLYRGLMVLEQADREGLFDPQDRWNKKFAFSHLWTALGYRAVQKFLGVRDQGLERPNPVPKKNHTELRELLLWLYGDKNEGKKPIVERQNPDLRHLIEVLENPKGVALLRREYSLESALRASRGDERLFREAVATAEQALKEAKGLVATGYHGDQELLDTALSIQRVADSLYREMEQIHSSEKE